MKLISKLLLCLCTCLIVLSCSKDGDEPQEVKIEGKWEYYKTAYFADGVEVEEDYEIWNHSCEKSKDYRFFAVNGNTEDTRYSAECEVRSAAEKWEWFNDEDMISINLPNKTKKIYKVLVLNETTLKLKYLKTIGVIAKDVHKINESNYLIFKRSINMF